jgi:hypothetical protein
MKQHAAAVMGSAIVFYQDIERLTPPIMANPLERWII